MTAPYLLDTNALIALVIADHEHHQRVATWARGVARIAVCPIVEGGLLRFLIRIGESTATATALLAALADADRCEFWADSISYVDVTLDHVHGHRQVTDAYLAALAASRGARLATLDEGLAAALPDQVLLIP
ncbi:TA system VapC family ribonuclease toxin [Thermasporomyces composti]|uniref:Ribonuclease VapC n=1 Tax=Thermasporomyces composti TaxID=696763 RepID=A0A3D9UZK3_THECX|nr:TA system VapC family ribonuclease toxin [Thermasporomyces composti]REF34659.1 hypothetical protein DFJ64_0020 [Thermasporomyces composti]